MNNSKNRILIFLVVFLLLTNIAMLLYFTVFNNPAAKNHGDRRGPVSGFLKNDLGFNKDQMDRLDSLKKQHRVSVKPLFDELGESKDAFYQLLGKPGTTDSVLNSAADNIGKKQAALDLQFYKNFISIRNLCTDQQLPKFDSAMPNITSRMMQPWQNNNGRKKDSTDTKK